MIIVISKDLRIEAEDGMNYTVQVRKARGEDSANPGSFYWKTEGYHADLGQAAVAILRKELAKGPERVKVDKLIAAWDGAVAKVIRACEGAMSAAHAATFEGVVTGDDIPDDLFDFPEDTGPKSEPEVITPEPVKAAAPAEEPKKKRSKAKK